MTRFSTAALLAAFLTAPALAEDPEALIDRLGTPGEASAAADAIVAKGEAMVPHLIGEAFEGQDLVRRGWAIVCLSEIGGETARERLTALSSDEKHGALIRTWAAAARIHTAQGAEELIQLAETLVPRYPAVGRPASKALVAALTGEGASLESVIALATRVPVLQKALVGPILSKGSAPLIAAMTGTKDQAVRRMAAGYLGGLFQQGDPGVPAAVVAVYAFDAQAKDVPWAGGPLFLPGIQWGAEDARGLVGNLIRWLVWADLHERPELKTQIHNNIRSLSLARAAGYQGPGWQEIGVGQWLTIWGNAVGKAELKALLKEQGALKRYQSAVDAVEKN
jgi:hypothetical protein